MKNNILKNHITQETSLNQLIGKAQHNTSTYPLDQWQPTKVSPFPLKIDKHGTWYHQNSKMTRQSLINLFAKVLWQQEHDGVAQYFLKTPTDLYAIEVEDVPLFINRIDKQDDSQGISHLVFYTTTDDSVLLDKVHLPYFAYSCDGELCAYLPIRYHLVAKIMRSAFYHLINLGELVSQDNQTALILNSGNQTYTLVYPENTP